MRYCIEWQDVTKEDFINLIVKSNSTWLRDNPGDQDTYKAHAGNTPVTTKNHLLNTNTLPTTWLP